MSASSTKRRGPLVFCLAFLAVTAFQSVASASDERLTFRVNEVGQIEAVVSGLYSCGETFLPPIAIVVNESSVLITSEPSQCNLPLPPGPYEVATVLGDLQHKSYSVVWQQSNRSLLGMIDVAALREAELVLTPGCQARLTQSTSTRIRSSESLPFRRLSLSRLRAM
jgi:hypothetical protein